MNKPVPQELRTDAKVIARPPHPLLRLKALQFNQEKIVLAITIVLFASFCLTLDQFATPGNLISLLQSVAILGVLGVGMSLVVIGRGIDLTMVTIMAISVGWVFNEINDGLPAGVAFALGFGLAAVGRNRQWRSDCLCRNSGDLRDAGDGHLYLRARPFRVG